jgi:integrase
MPKPRNTENRGLPPRWRLHHGVYQYRVPPGLEDHWDGKRYFTLGRTLAEAHATYNRHVVVVGGLEQGRGGTPSTAGQLLDRYACEVVPTKGSPLTRRDNLAAVMRLKQSLNDVPLNFDRWPMLFYEYAAARKRPDGTPALTAAHRELEVLSHAFTRAVRWGLITRHPTLGQVRLDGELALRPRSRYVEDWEVLECLALPSRRRKGSVLAVQAYIRLKLATGLSRGDLLRLRVDEHIREDGIHVTRHKTKRTGKRTIYQWTPERRQAVDGAIAVRPALSPFVFCDRRGQGYIDEATGECHGWGSMWARFMDRVLAETKITERFTEHDLRAKVGSDAGSLDRARALLQHADARTTQRFYRRAPERV